MNEVLKIQIYQLEKEIENTNQRINRLELDLSIYKKEKEKMSRIISELKKDLIEELKHE